MVSAVEGLLARSRAGGHRPSPLEAYRAAGHGVLLGDIRPAGQRAHGGGIPGALVIECNALEWRIDPAGTHRIPQAESRDVEVVMVCSEGYASSLAAASLRELGLARATDLVGGFLAWAAQELPTLTGPRPSVLPGDGGRVHEYAADPGWVVGSAGASAGAAS
ncbi:rhodanese-like domain-containing protein [Streptomyces massasporeus]|uniref:rhodanese-like domain-containing protein n=1 Tax=Streptomyces massasporeus TaxID=67324 RepID=UPI0036A49320